MNNLLFMAAILVSTSAFANGEVGLINNCVGTILQGSSTRIGNTVKYSVAYTCGGSVMNVEVTDSCINPSNGFTEQVCQTVSHRLTAKEHKMIHNH